MEYTQPERDVPVLEPGIGDGEEYERGSCQGIQPPIGRTGGGNREHLESRLMSTSKVSSQTRPTLAANITDFTVRTMTDLGKTTRIALPPGNGTEKLHTVLWWLCRASSSDNLRSGFIGGKVGVDRGDVDVARLFSTERGGMGDEDLREVGEGSLVVSGSGLSGAIDGWTFLFKEIGISEVAVCVRLAASGRGSS